MFKILSVTTLMLVLVVAGIQAADPKPVIKEVPIARTSAASGQEMFTTYCAVCHGVDGKGGGPAASALKMPPPDLTVLSKNNGGSFPSSKVYVSISGDFSSGAHGSPTMPVWGHVFRASKNPSDSMLRVSNLTKYVATLQQK